MLTRQTIRTWAFAAVLAAAAAWVTVPGVASAAPGPAGPAIRGAGSASAIPNSYIVVLKDTASAASTGIPALARTLSDRHGGRLGHVYQYSLHGFSATMSEAEALALAAEPDVAYVEQDQRLQEADTQEPTPSWGLDRIDQPALPLDNLYSYDPIDPSAPAVTAYILDSGVRVTLPDFGGRASWGWDFVNNTAIADDCDGHGTHVAGIVGGTAYGVAKTVNLVSVRIFDCTGKSTSTSVQAGIEWVTAHAVKPAVANLSLDSTCVDSANHPAVCPAGSYDSVKTAINNAINAGITFVLAAGNYNVTTCGTPFGQIAAAIDVAATTSADAKAGFSNWGSCVDLWAPGNSIVSDYIGPTTKHPECTSPCTISGTSQAAPHVTGAIARLLAMPGWSAATPADIKAHLLSSMVTVGKITGLDAGSPNKLLYLPPPPVAGGSSIAVARNGDGRLGMFGIDANGRLLYRTQTAAGAGTWSAWTESVTHGWYSVAAQTDGQSKIDVLGLTHTPQAVWLRAQAAVDANAWFAPHQLDGLLSAPALAADSTGRLELFGANSSGQMWHRSQLLIAGQVGYTPWEQFGPAGVLVRSVAADRNADNLVEVSALSNAGQIYLRWETSPSSGTYTPWVQLDKALATIAVARNDNGALQLYGVDPTGQVFRREASSTPNNWFSWSQLATPAAMGTPHSIATETNKDGRVELFAVNTAGQVWHCAQISAGSDSYTAWTQIPGSAIRP